jgi:hypothetical protein
LNVAVLSLESALTVLIRSALIPVQDRDSALYTFEVLEGESVLMQCQVRWYTADPVGARSAAIAQLSQNPNLDMERVRVGREPVAAVAVD